MNINASLLISDVRLAHDSSYLPLHNTFIYLIIRFIRIHISIHICTVWKLLCKRWWKGLWKSVLKSLCLSIIEMFMPIFLPINYFVSNFCHFWTLIPIISKPFQRSSVSNMRYFLNSKSYYLEVFKSIGELNYLRHENALVKIKEYKIYCSFL